MNEKSLRGEGRTWSSLAAPNGREGRSSSEARPPRTRWRTMAAIAGGAIGIAAWFVVIPTQSFTRNPAEVQRLAREIQPVQLPAELRRGGL